MRVAAARKLSRSPSDTGTSATFGMGSDRGVRHSAITVWSAFAARALMIASWGQLGAGAASNRVDHGDLLTRARLTPTLRFAPVTTKQGILQPIELDLACPF